MSRRHLVLISVSDLKRRNKVYWEYLWFLLSQCWYVQQSASFRNLSIWFDYLWTKILVSFLVSFHKMYFIAIRMQVFVSFLTWHILSAANQFKYEEKYSSVSFVFVIFKFFLSFYIYSFTTNQTPYRKVLASVRKHYQVTF